MYINKEVKEMPYRIWFRQFNDDGEIIGEGVYNKSYKQYGTAKNVAKKQYRDMRNVTYIVAKRNPWITYHERIQCKICSKTFEVHVTCEGYGHTAHVHLQSYKREHPITDNICPDCHDSIAGFIQSLRKVEEVQ